MGYGRTDSPAYGLKDFTYRRIADDMAELCRQLGLSQVILGGHDWGGAIVYRIALLKPELIKALFVICTPYNPPVPTYTPLAVQVATKLPNFGYQLVFASGLIEEQCNNADGDKTVSDESVWGQDEGRGVGIQCRGRARAGEAETH